MKLEPTEIEFQAAEGGTMWQPAPCAHCTQPLGYHWQTAEGKIYCTRPVPDSGGDRG